MNERATGCAALLAGLPNMTPVRLRRVIEHHGPEDGWARATSGRPGALAALIGLGTSPAELEPLVTSWRTSAERDPVVEAVRHERAGVAVLLHGEPGYPVELDDDHAAPSVLFAHGGLDALVGPRVAIVGTRRCTGVGATVARDLGGDLAAAGVAVVSGLALGVDGAAHAGALAAGSDARPPVGVIGCGHDRPYPPRHRALWEAVRARGLLLGECPLGTRPAPWRFPARNRLIAGLADVLVVVESHARGGSLLTVQDAIDRGVPVMAVPGSVRSPASAGANQLLADGCHPVRDVDDVLVALGLRLEGRRGPVDHRCPPDATGRDVLAALGWEAASLEQLAVRTGRPVPELSLALHRLELDGWLVQNSGWFEQVRAR